MTSRRSEFAEAVRSLVDRARREGRQRLTEAEGLELLSHLGLRVPAFEVMPHPEAVPDLARLPGDRVVVKLLSADVTHRTEVGGVRVVPRDPDAVRQAAGEMAAQSPDPTARFLVAEFVEHDQEPGGELLLSARWTEEFGAVVHLSLGGVTAEELVAAGAPGSLQASFTPLLDDDADVAALLARRPLGGLATGRSRGRAGRASLDQVAGVVGRFLEVAETAIPDLLEEIEVNPVAFRDGEAWALDAVVRLGNGGEDAGAEPGEADGTAHPEAGGETRREALHRLLQPRSVAVMGVSQSMNPGRVILRNVLASGFPTDAVQVVKPGLDELDGCRCVPSVSALEPAVDVLVLSIAADQVPDVMEEVVDGRRAGSVILIPGGLEEGGGEGGERVRALLRTPDAPVVNGANCLGIRSVPGSFDTLFIPPYKLGFPETDPDPVALISQSGAFAIARASGMPRLNPRYVITVGTQMDVTVGEYLEHLADDEDVRVFGCYVEGFQPGDGARFLQAARRVTRSGRAVVLYRAGRTAAGKDATASHTASMAGDFTLTRELAAGAGALVADTLEEFHDLLSLSLLLDGRTVGDGRVGALSNAGFECVAMADSLKHLELGPLGPTTVARLEAILESHRLLGIVAPRNPLDLTPILTDEAFAQAAAALLDDEAVGVGVVGCVPLTPALQTLEAGEGHAEDLHAEGGVVQRLRELWRKTDKVWVAVVDAGPRYDAMADALAEEGIPTFRTGDRAVRALERYVLWRLR